MHYIKKGRRVSALAIFGWSAFRFYEYLHLAFYDHRLDNSHDRITSWAILVRSCKSLNLKVRVERATLKVFSSECQQLRTLIVFPEHKTH